MKNKIFIFTIMFTCQIICYESKEKKFENIELFSKIEKWEDVKPFEGQLIAYKTNNWLLSKKNIELNSTYFGYVSTQLAEWESGGYGYNLHRLIEFDSAPSTHPLINNILNRTYLYIRLVTEEELNTIENLLNEKKAELEYADNDDCRKIFQKAKQRFNNVLKKNKQIFCTIL